MSNFAWLSVATLVACPLLIWVLGAVFDRPTDNGTAYGCCILWLVLLFAWFAQALYELAEWSGLGLA